MRKKTEVSSPEFINSLVLSVIHNRATASSREVAIIFEKNHDDVLKAIRNLEIPDDFRSVNFADVEIIEENAIGGKINKSYVAITRDGFTILAMGFTGKKAMQFKLAYIAAFNKMEAELMRQAQAQIPEAVLTSEHVREVQKLIGDSVYKALPKETRALGFKAIYRTIKDHFKVGSYKDVPERRYGEVMQFVFDFRFTPKVLTAREDTSPSLQHEKIDEKTLAETIAEEIMKRMPIAQQSPQPMTNWHEAWSMLEETDEDLISALKRLKSRVKDILPRGSYISVPDGADVLTWVQLHYSAMEQAARQIDILSEILMWRSPKVLNLNMSLGRPRY